MVSPFNFTVLAVTLRRISHGYLLGDSVCAATEETPAELNTLLGQANSELAALCSTEQGQLDARIPIPKDDALALVAMHQVAASLCRWQAGRKVASQLSREPAHKALVWFANVMTLDGERMALNHLIQAFLVAVSARMTA